MSRPSAVTPGKDDPSPTVTDKPLPDPERPGTSGTELNLRSNRERASTAFQRAQRAEQAYRAKRQARNARKDVVSAKEHFREGFRQLRLGMGCAFRVVRAVPAVVSEKQEARRSKSEVRKREKAEEKKRRLDEEIMKADGEKEESSEGPVVTPA